VIPPAVIRADRRDHGAGASTADLLNTDLRIGMDIRRRSADLLVADLPCPSQGGVVIERHLPPLILEALGDTRVVVVLGAREVGKSTLVQGIASTERPATMLTLDDQATRDSALDDPAGFVAGLKRPVVIDEVQRAPDLLLAIKVQVDRDPTPGQFLLTSSANILTAPRIADALTGRAEYLRLTPFSQGELAGDDERQVGCLSNSAGSVVRRAGARAFRRD